jgi:serine protease Do
MKTRMIWGILACAAAGAMAPAASAQVAPPAQPRARIAITPSDAPTSFLGIGVADIDAERAKALNLKEERGAEITNVYEGSPAAKAGIKEHDVVLEFGGQTVQGMEHLKRLVAETPVGRQVRIVVWRNGAAQTLTAAIGSKSAQAIGPGLGSGIGSGPGSRSWTLPAMPGFQGWTMPEMDMPNFSMTWRNPRLGIIGEPLGKEDQLAEFFGVKDGVLVKSVVKSSPAEKAGIRAGDVIVKVADSKIATAEDITRALRSVGNGQTTCVVTVVRGKKETPITVTLEPRTGGPVGAAVRTVSC